VIWFVDIEKGRENCRQYVEDRKLIRVAKEAGLTADEVVEGTLYENKSGDAEVGEGGSKRHVE
jgi:hypothetical protein